MDIYPVLIKPHSDAQTLHTFLITWNNQESFTLSYLDVRFFCPCAHCVDEHTGQRTLRKETLAADVRPLKVSQVGRYAFQIGWSDGHDTGLYSFKMLYELCVLYGKKLSTTPSLSL